MEEFKISQVDGSDRGVGITTTIGGPGLFKTTYTTEEQAIHNLKNLLLTARGERRLMSSFGTDILRLLFNQNTETLRSAVKDSIESAISFWLPYIEIVNLEVSQELEGKINEHAVAIRLTYRVANVSLANRVMLLYANTEGVVIAEES